MKTLGKLKINQDRILKDEELRSLNGGDCWTCTIYCPGQPPQSGQGCGPDWEYVMYTCNYLWTQGGCFCDCD